MAGLVKRWKYKDGPCHTWEHLYHQLKSVQERHETEQGMTLDAQMNGATATEEFVQYEVADGVGTIWLNRPEVMNCVNWGLLTQLGEALDRAEADDDVRVVLIRGRGHTFCAGADLNMLDAEFLGTTNNSVRIAQVSARTFDRAFNLAKPTVAVVEGYAVAGGFELMISCDFAVV